ncbi:MAG: quinolinate synthase NadA [Dehalococcoidales bacterium]|nr:quinolinate synthase NadA [Dehalococcoidales bacterium]
MMDTDAVARIKELKRDIDAVILAHNYQWPEVQDVADFVGDSLELSRQATKVAASTIVFCGVHFMAETAAILNPSRRVLLAHAGAGCPMADMIDEGSLQTWKEKYPEAAVVCYVNSSAAVKAMSDVCCTSANAVKVVEAVPQRQVLFVPDENLGRYVATKTDKEIITYPGFCITHYRLRARDVEAARQAHPNAVMMAHPECREEVWSRADAVLSTSQMLRFAKENPAQEFVVATECGILHRLQKENPGKTFHLLAENLVCPNMKKTTLASVVRTMEKQDTVVSVPEEIRVRALSALERMLSIA